MTEKAPAGEASRGARPRKTWRLRLYVAGMTRRALTALHNLEYINESQTPEIYTIEVVDLLERPQLARGDQIVAVPTLVRRLPSPMKKIIGDLSNSERVLVGLDIQETGPARNAARAGVAAASVPRPHGRATRKR